MAKRIGKRELERRKLNRRINAYNKRAGEFVLERVAKGESYAHAKSQLARELKKEKELKAESRLKEKIEEYNASKKTERSKFKVKVDILTQKQKEVLKDVFKGKKKKKTEEVKRKLQRKLKLKAPSVSGLGAFLENARRLRLHMETVQSELYYNNLLRALARVGAWEAYRKVQQGGISYAIDMLNAGFDIDSEVYALNDGELDNLPLGDYLDDEALDEALKLEASGKGRKKSGLYGRKVFQKLKEAERLHKSNIRRGL